MGLVRIETSSFDTRSARPVLRKDGTRSAVNRRITVLSVRNDVPVPTYTPTKPGHRWVRVRIRLKLHGSPRVCQCLLDVHSNAGQS